ncbi:MAG: hypothetical protein EHM53_08310 [Methanoregulaceae archaeon]|nr:MAG: hypothetical protein EHM53_08310 [Methanoregulaceae archaeon]
MNYLPLIVVLVAAIIIAGCASEPAKKVTVVSTSPVITSPAVPTTAAQKMVTITSVVTTKPLTTKMTTAPTVIPSKPIPSPVTVNGTSGRMWRFFTVAPGIVKFTIQYMGNYDNSREGCSKDDRAFIRLAGSSIDTTLHNGPARDTYTGTATYNLISPGNYSLTTKGCLDWRVVIDNA